jgi:predicted nucleic acid-binding protein
LSGHLLDTNIVSEVRKPRPHGAVIAWLAGADRNGLYVSAVTLAELQHGAEITRRQDKAKALEIEAWIDRVAESFQILAMDGPCFREWARIMSNKSNTLSSDAMIAATARVHDLTVVTRNVRDFQPFGVRVLNPFEADPQ